MSIHQDPEVQRASPILFAVNIDTSKLNFKYCPNIYLNGNRHIHANIFKLHKRLPLRTTIFIDVHLCKQSLSFPKTRVIIALAAEKMRAWAREELGKAWGSNAKFCN